MSIRRFLPFFKNLFADNKNTILRDKKIQEAKDAYAQGKKKESLELFREVIGIDGSCKPARFEIGKISGELKDEEKEQSGITPKKPNNQSRS